MFVGCCLRLPLLVLPSTCMHPTPRFMSVVCLQYSRVALVQCLCVTFPQGLAFGGKVWVRLYLFSMNCQKCVMLNWNVRGLNNSARRGVVKDLVFDTRCTVACLQETKIQHVDTAVVNETLGHQFIQNFVFLPAQQTRGGALLAVHQDF